MFRLTSVRLVAALCGSVVLLHFATARPVDPSADEMKKLQGTWQVTRFVDSSEEPAPASETATFTFEFRGNLLAMRKEKQIIGGGDPVRFALDPLKTPRAIDVFFTGDAKHPTPGIYKLDGDELTICIVAGVRDGKAATRPTEFKASKGDLHSLFVLKKVADVKPARANVYVYPEKLTAKDRLVDGPGENAHAIEIDSEATLIWVDLAPDYRFAHATQYVLITPGGTRTYKGSWWPVLNGKRLFRDTTPYKTDFPVQLKPE